MITTSLFNCITKDWDLASLWVLGLKFGLLGFLFRYRELADGLCRIPL